MRNKTKYLLCIALALVLIVLPSCSMFWSSNPTYSGGQMLDDELMSSMRDEVLGEKTEISDQEVSDEITEDENESENSHEITTEENESENSHEKTESSESQDNTESSKINEESSTKHDQEESSTKHDHEESSTKHDHEESSTKRDQEESSTKHDHQESTPVYWTENGGVYHLFRDCSYIKSSAEVISGTVEEANDAGKSDACSRCQNRKDKE